jgi:hypothetical protein
VLPTSRYNRSGMGHLCEFVERCKKGRAVAQSIPGGGSLYRGRLRVGVGAVAFAVAISFLGSAVAFSASLYNDVSSFVVPTAANALLYSPAANALVLRNSASEAVAIDLGTQEVAPRLAVTRFTDIALSPSGRYAFAADYGGENIGYGTPSSPSYVHRIDLTTKVWDMRSAYIAGNVQAVSDTEVILKSIDQWVTFTYNEWTSDSALVQLTIYYPSAYYGDFRFDTRYLRLLHGNSGSSSQEIAAWRIVGSNFVPQEASGIYGSAQGYGGTVALATDGSAFYYGRLQVDALDITHNLNVFPEAIYAANGDVAFGEDHYYDAHSGALLGTLPFPTTVYAMNAAGGDFWAYDPATTTVHHFMPTGSAYFTLAPCRIFDSRTAAGPESAAPSLAPGEARVLEIATRCGIPLSARSLAVNLTSTRAAAAGNVKIVRGGRAPQAVGVSVSFRAGQTRASNGFVDLPLDGSATVMMVNSSPGQVDFVVDVSGFFE